ncbi:hypothetical protein GTP44_04960 [Duganella sp. FT50W]|uniref:Killing trait domain-containing protein n=1 Tax=Duganella lactea TaxID=2692173 RepID=A0A6L8MP96_9BURK|nr:hypothetical protein [Duganella lactea]MYM34073.1 hypothetical protein [Duganella lactea]MYM81308.1 hypothetical protein [Duganella lactea]
MDNTNAQVIDTINNIQLATMAPQVVMTSGAGKAYQSVAQSTAIAVQDSADTMRNLSTIATTAIGVAMAQLLATKDPKYVEVITAAQNVISQATTEFGNVGNTAAAVIKAYPAG